MEKKLFTLSAALIFAVCSLFFCISASAEVYSGNCGKNITYTLDTETGVIEFTGNGRIYISIGGWNSDGTYRSSAPWGNAPLNESIKTAKISEEITGISVFTFFGCINLTTIEVDENNKNYCDIDGVLYTKNKDTVVWFPDAKSTSYTIPDGVKSINDYAFFCCTKLNSITIPDSVTSIGSSAFVCCNSLTSITIPDSVTSIGDYAFSSCSSLTSVTFKTKNAVISYWAFDDCDNLETIYLYKNSTADEYFSDEEYTKIYLDDVNFGDASGDDIINAKDMMLFAKSFTGWDVEIDKTAADCNIDGVFDIKDLVLLAQYLAGWNVTLG